MIHAKTHEVWISETDWDTSARHVPPLAVLLLNMHRKEANQLKRGLVKRGSVAGCHAGFAK